MFSKVKEKYCVSVSSDMIKWNVSIEVCEEEGIDWENVRKDIERWLGEIRMQMRDMSVDTFIELVKGYIDDKGIKSYAVIVKMHTTKVVYKYRRCE